MAAQMKYEVVFEPDEGGGWHVYIPAVRGCRTWGRSLEAARRYIREALATCVDVLGVDADEIARDAEFIERMKLSPATRKAIAEYQRTKTRADQLIERSQLFARQAATELTRHDHVSLRDAGALLGLSHERVNQMVAHKAKGAARDHVKPAARAYRKRGRVRAA
jgi:predicted RNase H-like HicB family nuclease